MQLTFAIQKLPLIAILRGITPDAAIEIAQTLIAAGFSCIEVPMNSPNALESIEKLARTYKDQAIIGAGTVTQVAQIEQIAQRGGKLIVMPHADTKIIMAAKTAGLYCIPGFSTATEAFAALAAGADALKLFPAEAAQPQVLRALRAVLPKEAFIFPVGGITPAVMASYIAAGANGFGLGSALYKPGDNAAAVANKAKQFIEAIRLALANPKF